MENLPGAFPDISHSRNHAIDLRLLRDHFYCTVLEIDHSIYRTIEALSQTTVPMFINAGNALSESSCDTLEKIEWVISNTVNQKDEAEGRSTMKS